MRVKTFLEASWDRAWSGLGATGTGHLLRDTLLTQYDQPSRRFHTRQHLIEALNHFAAAASSARHPAEVELAIWFHDAIWTPDGRDDEARSAEWARDALRRAGVDPSTIDRTYRFILATATPEAAVEHDACLVIDLDHVVLAAAPSRFQQFEAQVRDEMPHLSEREFRRHRRRILNRWMERTSVFSTPVLQMLYEGKARANLQRALHHRS